jgi:uncharacterized membrane protein
MNEIEALARQLPAGTGSAFSGLSYQERLAGTQTAKLYTISILVVFLCLAALYESWSVPLSVLLVIPLGVVGAVLAANLRGLENNIYFQVALLTTMGLSAKNAILIVEFAEERYRAGMDLIEAALHAARPSIHRIGHRRRNAVRHGARDLLCPTVLRAGAQVVPAADSANRAGQRQCRSVACLSIASICCAPWYSAPASRLIPHTSVPRRQFRRTGPPDPRTHRRSRAR